MWRLMPRFLVLFCAVMFLSGCVSAESMIKHLSTSKRSWCLYWAGTPGISGPVLASGSGIAPGTGKAAADDDGTSAGASCTPQGHNVNLSGMGQAGNGNLGNGIVVTPSGDLILRTPRILREQPRDLEDVTPAPPQRRAPTVRPQSTPLSPEMERFLDAVHRISL